jgi:hypothetical protein
MLGANLPIRQLALERQVFARAVICLLRLEWRCMVIICQRALATSGPLCHVNYPKAVKPFPAKSRHMPKVRFCDMVTRKRTGRSPPDPPLWGRAGVEETAAQSSFDRRLDLLLARMESSAAKVCVRITQSRGWSAFADQDGGGDRDESSKAESNQIGSVDCLFLHLALTLSAGRRRDASGSISRNCLRPTSCAVDGPGRFGRFPCPGRR